MIKCLEINKSFKGKKVLNNITMDINNNSITSLIGSNGAGKSTLIGVVLDYYKLDSGKVIKNSISIMPDADTLYNDLTGYDFLTYMSKLKELPSNKIALSIAEELGIEKNLKDKIEGYSFGMKKKISFIQACIGNYDAYIFDEPTSGVDEPSAIKMLEIIQNLKKSGAAILLTSHNLDELERVSDYIYIIDRGTIIKEGNVTDIIASENVNKNTLYTLKSTDSQKMFKELSSEFQNVMYLLNDYEIEIEIEDDYQLGIIVSFILEKKYSLSEIYKVKKSLRESVYN